MQFIERQHPSDSEVQTTLWSAVKCYKPRVKFSLTQMCVSASLGYREISDGLSDWFGGHKTHPTICPHTDHQI